MNQFEKLAKKFSFREGDPGQFRVPTSLHKFTSVLNLEGGQ
jgi:hypothetical protein